MCGLYIKQKVHLDGIIWRERRRFDRVPLITCAYIILDNVVYGDTNNRRDG